MIISPSILTADFADLKNEIKKVEPYVKWLHIDVMDGHFVPNISIGVPVVKSIRKITNLFLDTHLMIENPEKYIDSFVKAGSPFHAEELYNYLIEKCEELTGIPVLACVSHGCKDIDIDAAKIISMCE